jgi:hypothetical protein
LQSSPPIGDFVLEYGLENSFVLFPKLLTPFNVVPPDKIDGDEE